MITGALTLQFATKNTIVIEYFSAVLIALFGLIGTLLLPESPKWLVNQGQMEKARSAYLYMARVNGKSGDVQNEIGEWSFKQQFVDQADGD